VWNCWRCCERNEEFHCLGGLSHAAVVWLALDGDLHRLSSRELFLSPPRGLGQDCEKSYGLRRGLLSFAALRLL